MENQTNPNTRRRIVSRVLSMWKNWDPMSQVISIGLSLVDTGKVPDWLIRWVIRRLCESRIKELERKDVESSYQYIQVRLQFNYLIKLVKIL